MDGVSCASLMHISTRTFAFFFFFSFFFGIKKKKIESTAVWGAFRCHRLLERLGGRVRCLLSAALSYMQINRGVWRAEEGGEAPLCSTGRAGAKRQLRTPRPGTVQRPGALLRTVSRQGLPRVPLEGDRQLPLSRGASPPPTGLSRGRKREPGFAGVARGDPHHAVPCRPGIT